MKKLRDHFTTFGIYEKYGQSLELLAHTVGMPLRDGDVDFNARPGLFKDKLFEESDVQALRSAESTDIEFYSMARERFEEMLARQ